MSVLTLLVTSENAAGEKRFDPAITVARLKERLETITGISLANIKVELYDSKNNLIAVLSDESRPLNSYPVQDFMRLNVIDTNPYRLKNEFTDVSRVEKYEMPETEYDKRSDSVRQFLQRNKMGKYAEKPEVELYDFKKEAEGIKVGDRCEVEIVAGGMKRRGTVMFCGETKFKHGYWVGVEYDEPFGKNDGEVDGHRYFQCRSNHGAFLRPDKVTVGDFPEEDLMDELDEL